MRAEEKPLQHFGIVGESVHSLPLILHLLFAWLEWLFLPGAHSPYSTRVSSSTRSRVAGVGPQPGRGIAHLQPFCYLTVGAAAPVESNRPAAE